MIIVNTVQSKITSEAATWRNRVLSAGGSLQWNSLFIANNFIQAIKNKSYYRKIIYLLPMLGVGINAARVPLVDTLNVGTATNNNFVNSDFSQSFGLTGNGSTKFLNILLTCSNVGSTAGLGYYNMATITSGDERCGAVASGDASRHTVDLRTNNEIFSWCAPVNGVGTSVAASIAHYYGQQIASNNRKFYRNATQIGSNTTNDVTSPPSLAMYVLANNHNGTPSYANGTCGLFYVTNGTFSTDEISDFNITIRAYLLGPTGKPQS